MIAGLVGLALAADPVRLPVPIGDTWGFVDETGALVIPATFDAVGELAEGRFPYENSHPRPS